jgi:uncharacterized membrane protein YgcG
MLRKIAFLCLALLWGVTAQAEYFYIKKLDVDIRIDADGYFEVKEDILVQFTEPRRGIFRTIPIRNKFDGETIRVKIYDIEVEGFKKKISTENNMKRIRIGDPDIYLEGEQRYVIRYKVKNAFLMMEDHTEFYWNVIGTEWPVSIESSSYRIELPSGVTLGSDDYRVFTGIYGNREADATIEYSDGEISGQITRPFKIREGLTVALRLPVEAIYRPSETEQFLSKYGLGVLPVGFLAFLISLFVRKGKNDKVVDMVHYYPPEDFSPAEAGAFIDDVINNRDIISLIPYWAGQGYLRMEEREQKNLFIFTDKEFVFIKLQALPADRPAYEHTVFNGLFASGDEVQMSDLKNKFYTTMASAKKKIKSDLMARNLYTADSVKWRNWLVAFSILSVFASVMCMVIEQFAAGFLFIPVAIISVIFYRYMLKRNDKGQKVFMALNGFKQFVDKADKPRLQRLLDEDASYFEKTLPYAVAFGMTKKWSQKFDGLFTEPPSWYTTYHHGAYHHASFNDFANNFDGGIREVQSVFTSQPGSSGGGGFSGGGSGGGFGGGGGGSW